MTHASFPLPYALHTLMTVGRSPTLLLPPPLALLGLILSMGVQRQHPACQRRRQPRAQPHACESPELGCVRMVV